MGKLKLEYRPYTLDFKFEAGTSRGKMTTRKIWFIRIFDVENPSRQGLGEAAPLPQLSYDNIDQLEARLHEISGEIALLERPATVKDSFELAAELAQEFPSIRMALEMALLDLSNGGEQQWFPGSFTEGKSRIPINGLIWMNTAAHMAAQIDQILEEGYTCIKLKMGALDFQTELDLIRDLRKRSDELVIRVDANGAFQNNEALKKLEQLAAYKLHSIEQPILPRQPLAMHLLCTKSLLPIALDEDLVGWPTLAEKAQLLDDIRPQFIVLKPSLLGGFAETRKWIELAEARNIGWWITSALESNLGLSAISQFTATFDNLPHQGLGTGQLFENNLWSRTLIRDAHLTVDPGLHPTNPFDL